MQEKINTEINSKMFVLLEFLFFFQKSFYLKNKKLVKRFSNSVCLDLLHV